MKKLMVTAALVLAAPIVAAADAAAVQSADAAPSAQIAPAARADIQAVIEAFRSSIIRRDKARFLDLFVAPAAPWQSVLTDRGLEQVRRHSPAAIKARFKAENNAIAFIDEVVNSEAPSEETFSDLRIQSDGDLASVTFAYRFLAAGTIKNWGTESWLMVRTESGWKIASIAYSVTLGVPDPAH